jgi:hypothetical protein
MRKQVEWTPGMDEMARTARGAARLREVARILHVPWRQLVERRALLREKGGLNHRWTALEAKKLVDWCNQGKKPSWMAGQLGLGVGKVYQYLNCLRRQSRIPHKHWSPEEDRQVLGGAKAVKGRTRAAVYQRRKVLCRLGHAESKGAQSMGEQGKGEHKIGEGGIRTIPTRRGGELPPGGWGGCQVGGPHPPPKGG